MKRDLAVDLFKSYKTRFIKKAKKIERTGNNFLHQP